MNRCIGHHVPVKYIKVLSLTVHNNKKIPVELGRTVSGVSFVGLTLPKSASFMWPSDVSNKFSGWYKPTFNTNKTLDYYR